MSDEALDQVRALAERAGVFLDFDGTLSEIAAVPEAAVAIPGAAETLEGLARRFRLVALVTGRQVAEVERRMGRPEGVRVFGLYGLERDSGDEPSSRASAPGSRAVEEVLPRVLEIAAGIPGSLVEPKGPNLAVHYRLSPDPEAARAGLVRALEPLAQGAGLKLIEGKKVLELVPFRSPSKGDVVAREAAGLQAVLYAGDDAADIQAFAALDELAQRGVRTVKVAVRSAETPPGLLEAADLAVEGPAGLLGMLRGLLG